MKTRPSILTPKKLFYIDFFSFSNFRC